MGLLTRLSALAAVLMLSVVSLQAQAFKRDDRGHRVLPHRGIVTMDSILTSEFVRVLQGHPTLNVFYCAAGVPTPEGAQVTKLWVETPYQVLKDTTVADGQKVVKTIPRKMCTDSSAIGGFAVLAQPLPEAVDPSQLLAVNTVLDSRKDFVFLAAVDQLVDVGGVWKPRILWFIQDDRQPVPQKPSQGETD